MEKIPCSSHERDRAAHCIREEHQTNQNWQAEEGESQRTVSSTRSDPNYDYTDCSGELGDDDFLAIDPGNYSPYTWVQKNPQKGLEEEKPFLRETISRRWYERRSKRRARINRHKSDVRRFKLNEITAAFAEHHLKHVSYDAVKEAVKLRLKHQRRLQEVFSKRQRLKLRFEARIAEQKTIDPIVKRMRGKKKMKLIVFGDASRMSGIRGTTMGAPNAKIKRHALSRGLNEGLGERWRTSSARRRCHRAARSRKCGA